MLYVIIDKFNIIINHLKLILFLINNKLQELQNT